MSVLEEMVSTILDRAMGDSINSTFKKEIEQNEKEIKDLIEELSTTSSWNIIKRLKICSKIKYLVNRNKQLQN